MSLLRRTVVPQVSECRWILLGISFVARVGESNQCWGYVEPEPFNSFISSKLQFLHKNNAFRALGPAWSRRSSSNVDSKQNLAVTPHQPNGLLNTSQLNIVHHTMSTQINTVRSLHTTIVANSLKETLLKTMGLHRDSKSVNIPRNIDTQIEH